jgi:hypothetical protein
VYELRIGCIGGQQEGHGTKDGQASKQHQVSFLTHREE